MILTKPTLLGLILLLAHSAICTTQKPQRNRSQTQATTTISVNDGEISTQKSPVLSSTTQNFITTTSPSVPKTETSNKIIEQKRNRGSVKYFDPTPKATSTIVKETVPDVKNIKQTTIRNDRSLNINTDKYNPEYQSENNIYAETQAGDTKKYAGFNNKDKFTTEKVWERANFDAIELTTPKDDMFDSKHKKMQEDIVKSLDDKLDSFFEENKNREEADNIEKPQLNDSKLDYMRFRNLEAIESKVKNKIHKDYTNEHGMRMEMSSGFNDTKVIDAPGIVVNTIPTSQKDSVTKKPDLDQGETKIEKISIEKPNTFISNKIENEFGHLEGTEGSEDKPLEEHKEHIYLAKRGSTTQNREQIIEKSASTETVIPLELYPAISSSNLDEPTNISVSKNFKKLILKKDMDLDNKIPKFIPTPTENIRTSTTVNTITQSVSSTESAATITEETFDATDSTTKASDLTTSEPFTTTDFEEVTEFLTPEFEFYESTVEKDFSTLFYEMTDTPITDDTTSSTQMTTDEPRMKFSAIVDTDDKQDTSTEFFNFTDYSIDNGTDMGLDEISESTIQAEIDTESNVYEDDVHFANENVTENGEIDANTVTTESVHNTNFFSRGNLDKTTQRIDTTSQPDNVKKNETIPKIINEITKPSNPTTTASTTNKATIARRTKAQWESSTEIVMHIDEPIIKTNITKDTVDNETPKQNEININGGDKAVAEECDNIEDGDDYAENNCKTNNGDDVNEAEVVDLEDHNGNGQQILPQNEKFSTTSSVAPTTKQTTLPPSTTTPVTDKVPVITNNIPVVTTAQFNEEKRRLLVPFDDDSETTTKSESIISAEDEDDGGNGGKIAAIVISTIGGICLLLLVALLVIMKKRQKRFNYGQRCRPVSLDAYSMDNVSIHNSARRKGVLMASKRSYGNPAFEDPACPSHLLNYSELLKYANNQEGIKTEFDKIPLVTTKTNELPEGCDIKNRYANVIPLPETRVYLNVLDGVPSSDYINANYVTGPQGSRHYYIACQAPMQNTIEDFWRMIWEQQSKVVLMLTHLYENGVEKCMDYLPPSEVLDCHRLFGDYQITLKKREVKDKYIISNLQLKNMVSNSWREVTHLWYMGWPEKGVPDEANSIITFLIEARSYIKIGDTKIKETNITSISNSLTPNMNPVVVHCSPGTGRTGTVIACDIAVREFELTRKVDIPKIVYKIRRDRASAVQTKEQYLYIYKVINFYATKLTGGIFDSF